jgi:hypothetical protein
VRLSNEDVLHDLDAVLKELAMRCDGIAATVDRITSPPPLRR